MPRLEAGDGIIFLVRFSRELDQSRIFPPIPPLASACLFAPTGPCPRSVP